MRNVLVGGLIVVVVALLVWSGISSNRRRKTDEAEQAQVQALRVDKPGATASISEASAQFGSAPDLRGKTAPVFALTSMDGKRVSLDDLKGKPVLLNFWATWCAPCKVEMPWFEDFSKKYAAQGLQVVGVNEDDEAKPDKLKAEVSDTVKRLNVTYPILLTDHKVGDAYGGLDMLPATFYIDKAGVVRGEAIGLASRDEAEANVQKILQ
ncbi:TlpA family protein disulfide reductase [Terriglobus sp.]|uniref:TlpA family protein disulfide reductase n=1 Tax=Terriglobus sp. TaxID=1889013 RepID=UPI003AFF7563